MTTKSLNHRQIAQVVGLLDEHAGVFAGACRYSNGWSDAKIAEQVGAQQSQVARMRRELKGKLESYGTSHSAAHELTLELAGVVSRTALTLAELAEKLGEGELGKIARGLAQDATVGE